MKASIMMVILLNSNMHAATVKMPPIGFYWTPLIIVCCICCLSDQWCSDVLLLRVVFVVYLTSGVAMCYYCVLYL